jgi:HK97 family phage portal protein
VNRDGILTRLFERRALDENTGRGLIDKLRAGAHGGGPTTAGILVTPDVALTYGAVWACVRVLAESVASLPLILYRRLPGGGKERATDHPLYGVLHDAPNDEMTSAEWREAQMVNLGLWGNGYTQIVRDRAGRVAQLWPMLSRFMQIRRDMTGLLEYHTSEPSARRPTMPAAEMLHMRSLGFNGLIGLSPITMARQAIGLGLATERFGAAFFGNGARPGVMLEHPGTLSDEAYERLKESWNEQHQGVENAGKMAILEEGMKVESVGVPPDDAQFLETRSFQVTDVARWFRVPPHMIGDLSKATFSNIEHQSLDFVVHTLRPWLVRQEQSISRSLLAPAERAGLFVEHLVDGLLRGDITSRFNAYAIARQWGWLNADEIRERENMNPIKGGAVYFAPLNMTGLDQVGQTQPTADAAPVAGAAGADQVRHVRGNVLGALGYVYRDAVERIARRAVRDIGDAARKYLAKDDRDGFLRWLDGFAFETRTYIERTLTPVAQAHIELCGLRTHNPGERVSKWATQFLLWELDWIRATVDGARTAGADAVAAIDDQLRQHEGRVGEWAQVIAQLVARDESMEVE